MRQLPARIRLLNPGRTRFDALVVILQAHAGYEPAGRLAEALRLAVPGGLFALFEVDLDRTNGFAELDIALTETCLQLRLQPSQVILLGQGRSARFALDSALRGAHPICGALVVCPPSDTEAPPASWRLVRVRILQRVASSLDDERLRLLLESLHAREIDVRCMVLPPANEMDTDVVLRAAEVFLVELVACASRSVERRANS